MKIAVVLCNFGGIENTNHVKKFIFNILYSKNKIKIFSPLLYLYAKILALQKYKKVRHIYIDADKEASLFKKTFEQAEALQKKLTSLDNRIEFKVFVAMKYWDPLIKDTVLEVKKFAPTKIIVLPLYPQFSQVASRSIIEEWFRYARKYELSLKIHKLICCFSEHPLFAGSYAEQIKKIYQSIRHKHDKIKIIFSAYCFNKNKNSSKDPYEWQIYETIRNIIDLIKGIDVVWSFGYLNSLTSGKAISPSIQSIIIESANIGEAVIVVPVSFLTSSIIINHEINIHNKKIFYDNGGKGFYSIAPPDSDPKIIDMMQELIMSKIELKQFPKKRNCSLNFKECMHDYKF